MREERRFCWCYWDRIDCGDRDDEQEQQQDERKGG